MPTSWRLVRSRHAATAFDGEGARLYGGRWNSPGSAIVYTSASLSLAALETLVHAMPLTPRDLFSVFSVTWRKELVETIHADQLPKSWQREPPGPETMRLGDDWLRQNRSAILEVPSTILPEEANFLLNPRHAAFSQIEIRFSRNFVFDPRLAG